MQRVCKVKALDLVLTVELEHRYQLGLSELTQLLLGLLDFDRCGGLPAETKTTDERAYKCARVC